MKIIVLFSILLIPVLFATAQEPVAPVSFSDEQVARMREYNRHRIPDRLVITRDGMLPSPPDAISGFAKRNGVGLAEVGEAVFARVCENLAAQQYEQANAALSVLIDCDPEASRAHVKEFREWALHAGDPEVRCSCLWLVLNAERTDALPFVESAFRPDLLPAIGRVVLCNLFRRFVGANGDRTLSPEERAVWDAFLTRLVEREHEPEVFRKLDSVMCLNVEGWRFSDRRRRLLESLSREFLESAPDFARGIVRGIEIDRLAKERGETNEVLSWQTEPFDWSKAKVFDLTAEELRRSLQEQEHTP